MKKALIAFASAILISTLLISMVFAFHYNNFDTKGVVYLENKYDIKYLCVHGRRYCAISNSGNCYIGGGELRENSNYGVENIRTYNNFQNVNSDKSSFVRIYDKGDAVYAKITPYGGAIITENNDVYVFLNGNEKYRTPTYLCTGYESAIVGNDSKVYLLSQNGVLEYIDINNPDKKRFIGDNIKKFDYERKSNIYSIFALTNDNKLYIINPDEQIENNEKYLSDITDFDILVPHEALCVFTYVNTKGTAYFLMDDLEIDYNDLNDSSFFWRRGKNIKSVTAYDGGIAMLDDKGDLYLYGDDFHYPDGMREFNEDLVFSDVAAVFGGTDTLAILKTDGKFYHYGKQADLAYIFYITPPERKR